MIITAYGGAVLFSALYGTPPKLPGIALGLPVLMHLERAAAVVAVLGAVVVVAYLTRLGYLPSQLGNVGYQLTGRQHELEQRVDELRQRIESRLVAVEDFTGENDDAVRLVRQELTELNRRLESLASGKRDEYT